MSDLYGFRKSLERVPVRSKADSVAKSNIVPTLIDGTPLAAPTTRNVFSDRTIPELTNWNVVVLVCKCGTANQNVICFRGTNIENKLLDAMTDSKIRGCYSVDWANNRIRVRYERSNDTLAPSLIQILAVYGLVQNVDVVDADTEDDPSGDEGEDIDITALTEEVQGIRIGADGTIYDTAGDAVRGQYSELAEILDAIGVDNVIEQINNAIAAIPSEVDEWLDDHPEATTTVQDGSITEAKINSGFLAELLKVTAGETVEVVADYDGLIASTADRVIVINDNSYYGSGETVTFIHSSNDLASVLPFQRTNGDYMIPEPKTGSVSSNPPTKQIGDVVGSYINKSELSYGGEYGAFNETCNAEIDCSTFAYLVMQGIDYNHSRYAGLEANVKGQYVGGNIPRTEQSLFSSRTAFNASETALFFACKNRLFNVDYNREHPCSQLQAGDIIFWSDASNERTYNRYLCIHHVAVVLQVYPESDVIQIAQAGSGGQYSVQPVGQDNAYNVCKLSLLSFTSDLADTIVTYARPEYGVITEKPKQVIKYAEFMGDVTTPTSGNRTALAKLYFKTPLDKDKLYTLSVKGDIPIDSSDVSLLALYVSTDDYNIYNCQIRNIVSTDKITISFVPCENIANAVYIWFAIWTPSSQTPSTTKTYNVSEIGIYEGLLPDIDPALSDLSNAVTFDTSIVTVSYCFAWKDDDENVHLRATVTLAATVGSDGFVTIGSIDLASLPKQAFSRERFCRKNGDPRAFMLTSATGMMEVYLKSGDTGSIAIDIEL